MEITGLHLLLSYQCTYECDHCFVWGSPWQNGTMTLRDIRDILQQAKDLRTVKSIYFEGGEPFLYYSILVKGVQEAAAMGFQVGIVSNAYWATAVDDAVEWLRPLVGLIQDLSVSSDLYHGNAKMTQTAINACKAAEKLNIPIGTISVAQPEDTNVALTKGKLPPGESGVMYRGRAAAVLAERATRQPWDSFHECPHEDLRDPGRVHVDPFGNVHICQGISLGNMFATPLRQIIDQFDPDSHPIVRPLLVGGPTELARHYELDHQDGYADACHLCDESCRALRERFPEVLLPDQMFGQFKGM